VPERTASAPGRRPASVIALFGPTGVGKTAVALALADRLRSSGAHPVAISADALQVYAGLETLTGAPSAAERGRLEHRLVGFVPVEESFSVGAYMPRAHTEVDAALAAGRTPIVVGGTGLYLRAALAELDLRPAPEERLRERHRGELRARGAPALHAELARRAPQAAAAIAPSDSSRVVRALELLEMGALDEQEPGEQSQLWTRATRHPTLLAGLLMDRDALYQRIDARVDAMVAGGAGDEVRRAVAAGASETARKALGFEELLAGDVEAMKRRTRNYAKRQLTWMRKLPGARLVDLTGREPDHAAAEIETLAR
jgi:tRNA dimethylallyltransferase